MGFVHPIHEGLINKLSLKLDKRGNVEADDEFKHHLIKFLLQVDRGLIIVWAISEGQMCRTNFFKEK